MKKVIVALSGGVDSAVSALLLSKRYNVSTGFIRGYNVDGCQDKELEDARKVAQHLKVPFYIFDLETEYKKRVVDYMMDGYRKGVTPNPDIVCNSEIKFGLFYEKAVKMGFDFVASGHYARIKFEHKYGNFISKYFYTKEPHIYSGIDKNKDQTYFLWQVSHKKFNKILFPIGNLQKKYVRKIAKKSELPVAYKKDSQGVCFLGKFNFAEFLRNNINVKSGKIIDTAGKQVGTHDGVWFYTIGQRHGFKNTSGVPFYVIKKDIDENILIVAYEGEKILYSNSIFITGINFLDFRTEKRFYNLDKINLLVRIRYRQKLCRATLKKSENKVELSFKNNEEKLFPASGQSAVFYNDRNQMLGGGIIV